MILPRFSATDMEQANESWGANCGPGAVAAICGLTLDEVKLRFVAEGFIDKRYTNPSMMYGVLQSIERATGTMTWYRAGKDWPRWGLARIQWEGPWTEPGVPMRARYRYTHWVGAARGANGIGVFDINAMANGSGWCSQADWIHNIVPWILLACVPRANGRYHITHAIEVKL